MKIYLWQVPKVSYPYIGCTTDVRWALILMAYIYDIEYHKSADHAKVDVHTDNILKIKFLHSPTWISELVISLLSLAQCKMFSAHFKDTEVLAR